MKEKHEEWIKVFMKENNHKNKEDAFDQTIQKPYNPKKKVIND